MLPLGGFTEIPDLLKSGKKQKLITQLLVQQQLITDLT